MSNAESWWLTLSGQRPGKSDTEKDGLDNDKDDEVDGGGHVPKQHPPHPDDPKQVYVCNDDDVMFGLCHPKGEQVRGRCPTELVTAPNVLVTTPVPPPHLQPPVM